MDIWCAAGEADGPALADLIARGGDAGCPLVPRVLSSGGEAQPADNALPFLLWRERDDPAGRAAAFHAGVDEIVGPWMDPDEALARLLRLARPVRRTDTRMIVGELDIDLVDRSARRGDRPLDLLRREYELLLHLARHRGSVQSREALLRAIWRLGFDPGTNVVQVHVSRLRAKLDRGFAQPMLHTVRGAGYCLLA